jgi:hypothetical protein
MPRIRSANDHPIVDGVLDEPPPDADGGGGEEKERGLDADAQREARKTAVARSSLALVPRGDRPLYGNAAFFRDAADQLGVSTSHGLELAGAVYTRETEAGLVLLGLKRCASGAPGRVAVNPEWGEILWHTHPGLKGSLAAFSNEDLEAAKMAKKPLLVVGFGGLSPDVLSTLTLPLGMRSFLVSAGIKGLLSLEKTGRLQKRLLRLGVGVRVCYPSGRIQPVLRTQATPLQHAFDDMSFFIDRGIGVVERRGQAAIKGLLARVVGPNQR